MKVPVRIAVTGAAGQIGYALLFRIAAGDMLGKDQPIILQLLEIPPAMSALKGVVMELNDAAFPLVQGIVASDDPNKAFKDANYALLVGSRPRGKGMERKDLLQANGPIFTTQGKALNDNASRDVKILVVGNPANTNALIAMKSAPDLKPHQFSAMTRLDHNRAMSQIAEKTGDLVKDIKKMIIWGNHSSTQVPDIYQAHANNKAVSDLVDELWVKEIFIPTVQKRGAAIIEARGSSSAASAASAAIDHMNNWVLGTDGDDWTSMAIPSDTNPYGIAKGIIYSFPVKVSNGQVSIVTGLKNNTFIQERMKASETELLEERSFVKDLF